MLQPKLNTPAAADAELYDRDPVLWSDQQAALLTMVAAGKRPANVDWPNIIEEIESVGRSQVNAVESLLLQALVHEFKIVMWPKAPYVEHWRNESLLFQSQAAQQFTASMRQKIHVTTLVYRAGRAVPPSIDGVGLNGSLVSICFDEAVDQVSKWLVDPDGLMTTISLTSAASR